MCEGEAGLQMKEVNAKQGAVFPRNQFVANMHYFQDGRRRYCYTASVSHFQVLSEGGFLAGIPFCCHL